MVDVRIDPFPDDTALRLLWEKAWGGAGWESLAPVLRRSLVHVGAYNGEKLIGFVNVAWDGGEHAFLLDTCVDPDQRRQGIATALVNRARDEASARGAGWLHVDFEPHLEGFYRACGFRPTAAGLIRLRRED